MRAFDANGAEQWQKLTPGPANGVNVTGDGRLVLAAYGDGTIPLALHERRGGAARAVRAQGGQALGGVDAVGLAGDRG